MKGIEINKLDPANDATNFPDLIFSSDKIFREFKSPKDDRKNNTVKLTVPNDLHIQSLYFCESNFEVIPLILHLKLV